MQKQLKSISDIYINLYFPIFIGNLQGLSKKPSLAYNKSIDILAIFYKGSAADAI